jgi:hypothetical protein
VSLGMFSLASVRGAVAPGGASPSRAILLLALPLPAERPA